MALPPIGRSSTRPPSEAQQGETAPAQGAGSTQFLKDVMTLQKFLAEMNQVSNASQVAAAGNPAKLQSQADPSQGLAQLFNKAVTPTAGPASTPAMVATPMIISALNTPMLADIRARPPVDPVDTISKSNGPHRDPSGSPISGKR